MQSSASAAASSSFHSEEAAARALVPTLQIEGLSKQFGATQALNDVSLSVAPGEVHALLGHNGSGKSTLVKLLSGYHRPDAGAIRFSGQELTFPTSQHALQELGVTFVHQDVGLVSTASVLENIRIGRFETGPIRNIKWRAERDKLRELMKTFHLDLDPDRLVRTLSASEKTAVGLVRAFQDLQDRENGLLVLDEPSASLGAHEVDNLLDTLRALASRGVAVLLVTHHLNEVLALADRVSALRDGRLICTRAVDGMKAQDLADLVVGDGVTTSDAHVESTATEEVVLSVESLTGHVTRDVAFELRRGEVLGVTGLAGSGHDEIPYVLFGARKGRANLTVGGRPVRRLSPHSCRQLGMALVSGDRARAGGVLPATVAENLTAPVVRGLAGRLRRINTRAERGVVTNLIDRFDVRPNRPNVPFVQLSGGNQQKALLGRWMTEPPQILMLDEPTSGVDVGAVDAIVETLQAYVRAGGAVLIATNQFEDLVRLADRVLVLVDGRVSHELAGDQISPREMLVRSYGHNEPAAVTEGPTIDARTSLTTGDKPASVED